jgi:hypothetical protein
MPSEALDRLIEIVTGKLDFSWELEKRGDWGQAWAKAHADAGPSRDDKALRTMAREIASAERELEWFPPPSREPPCIHVRRVLKLVRYWLDKGVAASCYKGFLWHNLVDLETRWPEEMADACKSWTGDRAAAANYITLLGESNRRTLMMHAEWPVPEPEYPDDLASIAQAVAFAVYLGVTPCTARFTATASSGERPDKSVLEPVVEALREGSPAEALVERLAALGVSVAPTEPRS